MTEKKLIIVTDRVKEYTNTESFANFPKIVECSWERIPALIKERQIDNSVLKTLILLKFDEYMAVKDMLSADASLIFSFIVFGTADDMNLHNLIDIYAVAEFRTSVPSEAELEFTVKKAFSLMERLNKSILTEKAFTQQLDDVMHDQEDLINIGLSLPVEKDPQKLLYLILYFSKKITGADAGSIYLLEEDNEKKLWLRFKASETFSREISLAEFVIPVNKNSIAGYVASTGKVLNIPDVYNISQMDIGLSHNSAFDKQNNYITRSMLVVPMLNHNNEVIGVIQLINSKMDPHVNYFSNEAYSIHLNCTEDFDRYVIPFDHKYDSLLQAIAGQAAVAIENNRLMIQIQTQFDAFVRTSVEAVESLDPTTSGHSFRVATLCVAMAKAVNDVHEGYLADYSFNEDELRELEFAALLHDFGKIYVDLSIVKKHKKLFPKDLENLMLRLDYLYRFVELDSKAFGGKLDEASADSLLKEIKAIKETVKKLNEPAITDMDSELILKKIIDKLNSIPCISPDGENLSVLTDENIKNLGIRKGSLNEEERKEIENHVVYTYKFLNSIPWPPEYKNIAEIALRHHEKLDGSGYPDGLKGKESIMLQSRIMAIADIYDALAAPDRPYKPAVSIENIIRILNEEADRGTLDRDVVNLFIDKKLYMVVSSNNRLFTT